MKMSLYLLTITTLGMLVLAGCGKTAEKTYKVNELVDSVTADQNAWKGKEVTVTGVVGMTSKGEGSDGFTVTLKTDPSDKSEKYVNCSVAQGTAPQGIYGKTVEVTGKVARVRASAVDELKNVGLEPCEIKQTA